jgi:hypothetical protein
MNTEGEKHKKLKSCSFWVQEILVNTLRKYNRLDIFLVDGLCSIFGNMLLVCKNTFHNSEVI